MRVQAEPYTQWHLRHGESLGNTAPGFGGGHPDDTTEGPVGLTPLGRAQAWASGIAATQLGLEIGTIFTSELLRATTTAEHFISAYLGPGMHAYEEIQALHEVCHGSAERRSPRPTPQEVDERYKSNVQIMGGLLFKGNEHAGWLTPTGFGDGESYLEAGLRVSKAIDEQGALPNALFVGHNGGLRQARVLARHLSLMQRQDLAEQYGAPAAEVRQEMQAAREAHGTRKGLADKDIGRIFALGAVVASETAKSLQAAGVPTIENVIGKKHRIGNGQFVEVRVEPDGKWTILRRLIPRFSKERQVLPTSSDVSTDISLFGSESVDAPVWW